MMLRGFRKLLFLIGMVSVCSQLQGAPARSFQEGEQARESRRRPVSMCLVVDGSQGWFTTATGAVADIFRTGLDGDTVLRVAAFDVETATQGGGVNPHLPLPPRTPFREALQACADQLASDVTAARRVIVTVVHEESYPSWLSTGRLVEAVQKSEIRVYSIRLARYWENDRPGLFRRFGRMFVRSIMWLADELAEGPGSSYGETSDLLSALSPDGVVCAASSEQLVRSCAKEIAARILEPVARPR